MESRLQSSPAVSYTHLTLLKEHEDQLGLFSAQQENPLRDAVAAVSLDTLTPIEALNKLYELKKML